MAVGYKATAPAAALLYRSCVGGPTLAGLLSRHDGAWLEILLRRRGFDKARGREVSTNHLYRSLRSTEHKKGYLRWESSLSSTNGGNFGPRGLPGSRPPRAPVGTHSRPVLVRSGAGGLLQACHNARAHVLVANFGVPKHGMQAG